MGRGGAVRVVRGGSYAPGRRWTVGRLRERAAEAWGDGSYEPREAPTAEPDPSESDLLEELGDRICRMAAHIHAATAHFLELVAEFDRRGGWKPGGHRSCAHWLVVRTGYTLRTARGYVRVARALEAAEDALYRKEWDAGAGDGDRSYEPRAAGREAVAAAHRRRAAAAGLLAERALAAGFGGDSTCDDADDGGDVPISGTRAERYQMFVHVDADTLSEEGEAGRSELEDGTRLAAETARRLACDAATVHVNRGSGGEVLDVGRRARTVPPALRRALQVRDRGCRFPGCGLRFCEAHHIKHWADGGETSLENTLLLCRRHHRLLHEEGWTVEWWGEGRTCFTDPRGGHHLDVGWQAPELPADPVGALVRENRLRGADPGPLTAGARWKRERDIPDEVWFTALEAGMAATAPP